MREPDSMGSIVYELLTSWFVWLLLAVGGWLIALVILYPHTGLMLAAIGLIAVSALHSQPARVTLTFVLVLLLLWCSQQRTSVVMVEGDLPSDEEESIGYGPLARP